MRLRESAGKRSRSSALPVKLKPMATTPPFEFVVCVRNLGFPVALEIRKIYRVLPDTDAAPHDYLRIVDESGEDYLYPRDYFMPIELSEPLQEALQLAG